MILVCDSREQDPLVFPKTVGVEVVVEHLSVGDYTARHGTVMDTTICERKSIQDAFTSFTGEAYERERAKILRAKEAGLTYILAVEATATEFLKGCSYWSGGESHEHKKTGLALLRQFAMLQRKYGVILWYCSSRKEMALLILEYFLAESRRLQNLATTATAAAILDVGGGEKESKRGKGGGG